MSVIPDPEAKTVSIPVRVKDGQVVLFYGEQPPGLQEGTVGELVVPAFSVRDPVLQTTLNREMTLPLLDAGIHIWFRLYLDRTGDAPPGLQEALVRKGDKNWELQGFFVEGVLMAALQLQIRGGKVPSLMPAACRVPCLRREADSLNHAYTLISTAFQPERRSHTGNVFDRCFVERGDRTVPLRGLREAAEGAVEETLWGTTAVEAARRRLKGSG